MTAPVADELADAAHAVEVLESEVVFDGRVWDVRRERFAYGATTLVRDFIEHPGAVAVLAKDDQDRILLIQQYRHPIQTRDWELPAGLLDLEGEDPLEAARRELAEEADLVAAHWEPLLTLWTTPGGSDEVITVFLATGLSSTPAAFEREAEELDITLRWTPLDEAVSAALSGAVRNGILIAAVLAAEARRVRQ
jgi:8-oxo-dGDP phosphatase